jgi:hypothetical protein
MIGFFNIGINKITLKTSKNAIWYLIVLNLYKT